MEPFDRLRLTRRGLTISAEAVAQRVAEGLVDLVVQAVDPNEILALVDLNALLGRVDVNTLLEQIDMNALLDRVDLNNVVGRIDMEKLVANTDVGAIIARSTGGIATEALDAARGGAAGLDQSVDRRMTRLLRRKAPEPLAPPAPLNVAAQSAEAGRRDWSVRSQPGRWVSTEGQHAGLVSRVAAYVVDLIVSSVIFELALTAISFVAQVITGRGISWHRGSFVVVIIYVLWQLVYFGFQWAANGKTLGMALLGLQVVQADGTKLRPWRGWVRSLTFPLGVLTLGLGFLGVLVQREHRALYDLIAGTTVVYASDARAARLRSLAHHVEPIAMPPEARDGTTLLLAAGLVRHA